MNNYNQTNIYKRQMQKLGLSTKEYVQLIDMPYEVVKDFLYQKKGEYSMDIKNLLRRNMVEKHEEIENNIDNAKIKATEIKLTNNFYLSWYYNEYSYELLKEKLNVKSIDNFASKYLIRIKDKRASRWFYCNVLIKDNIKKIRISKNTLIEFVEQLYDILVNNNVEKYYIEEENPFKAKKITSREFEKAIKWYEDFDLRKFVKENHLKTVDIANEMGVAYSTFAQMANRTHYSNNSVVKFYDWYKDFENTKNKERNIIDEIRQAQINGEVEKIEELKKEHFKNIIGADDNNVATKQQAIPVNVDIKDNKNTILSKELSQNIADNVDDYLVKTTNDMLRKILISRLTEEEKTLIKIFGGKIC